MQTLVHALLLRQLMLRVGTTRLKLLPLKAAFKVNIAELASLWAMQARLKQSQLCHARTLTPKWRQVSSRTLSKHLPPTTREKLQELLQRLVCLVTQGTRAVWVFDKKMRWLRIEAVEWRQQPTPECSQTILLESHQQLSTRKFWRKVICPCLAVKCSTTKMMRKRITRMKNSMSRALRQVSTTLTQLKESVWLKMQLMQMRWLLSKVRILINW